jgi:hypothetical protein
MRGMNVRTPIPLKPDPNSIRELSMRSLTRAVIGVALKAHDSGMTPSPLAPEDFLQQRGWENDRVGKLICRSAVNPAMTSTAGWAAELGIVAQAFLETLKPMSAAAQLLGQCLSVSFNRAVSIRLPSIAPGSAQFVAEGAPIRVAAMPTAAGPTMAPYKFATIVEITNEMLLSSNAEVLVRQALVDSTAPSLDAALLSNAAGVAGVHPAGILVGATSVTPSTATTKTEAMDDDLAALVAAIAAFAGNGSVAFVCAPAQATRIMLRAQRSPGPVLMSAALASGTVVAIATNALVSALEPIAIDGAKAVSVHQDDTSPQPIGNAGPTRSLWQTDSVALRMRMPVSWCVRNAAAVAVVTATKW